MRLRHYNDTICTDLLHSDCVMRHLGHRLRYLVSKWRVTIHNLLQKGINQAAPLIISNQSAHHLELPWS